MRLKRGPCEHHRPHRAPGGGRRGSTLTSKQTSVLNYGCGGFERQLRGDVNEVSAETLRLLMRSGWMASPSSARLIFMFVHENKEPLLCFLRWLPDNEDSAESVRRRNPAAAA